MNNPGPVYEGDNDKSIQMKALLFVFVIFLAISAQSQSLKEALYDGKLKADTGAVIRKGDSATIRENMAMKAAEVATEDSMKKVAADSIVQEALAAKKEKALAAGEDTTSITLTAADTAALTAPVVDATPKDNNTIWKSFIDSLTLTIRSEVIPSPKVKKGAYYVLVEYDIKPDGDIHIKNVSVDPESSFLQQQIKDRLTLDAPKLNPIIDANGRARNVARKQVMNFDK